MKKLLLMYSESGFVAPNLLKYAYKLTDIYLYICLFTNNSIKYIRIIVTAIDNNI